MVMSMVNRNGSDPGPGVDLPGWPDALETCAGRTHHVDQDVGRFGGVDTDLTIGVRLHHCEIGDGLASPEVDVRRVRTATGTGVHRPEAGTRRFDDREIHEHSSERSGGVEFGVADRETNHPAGRARRTVDSRVGHAIGSNELDRCIGGERRESVDDEVCRGRRRDAHVAICVRLRHHQVRGDGSRHDVDIRGLEGGQSARLNGHEARRIGSEGGDVQRDRTSARISDVEFEFHDAG